MKALPLHLEIQIHKAQTAAIEALQSGASIDNVRLDLGRHLFSISKVCGKRLWHLSVRRLGLKEGDARRMVRAAKEAERKAKIRADRASAPAAVVKGRKGYWLCAGSKNVAGPFPTHSEAWAYFDEMKERKREHLVPLFTGGSVPVETGADRS